METAAQTAVEVRREQEDYRESAQSALGRGVNVLTRPLARLLERTMPIDIVARSLRQIDELSARLPVVRMDHDRSDLDACRDVALTVEQRARVANAASGGTAGAGGALTMAADIPATLGVAMGNIRQTGQAYGYDGEGEPERLFRLRILELAALDDDEIRQERIAKLEASIASDGTLLTEEADVTPLLDQAVERIARALAFSFASARIGAGVPLVGAAVGAAVNASFQKDVSRAARFAFQARSLLANSA